MNSRRYYKVRTIQPWTKMGVVLPFYEHPHVRV
jgi:hypothetical protein